MSFYFVFLEQKESLILVGSSEAERRSAGGHTRRGECVRTEVAVETEGTSVHGV